MTTKHSATTFERLGVDPRLAKELSGPGHSCPFPRSSPHHPRRDRWPRRLREGQDGLRKDPRIRHPAAHAAR